MESTNSDSQPPIAPATPTQHHPETNTTTPTPPTPAQQQQQQHPNQPQQSQPNKEPINQPIALQVQQPATTTTTAAAAATTTTAPQSTTTQPIQAGQAPVSQEQPTTTTQQAVPMQISHDLAATTTTTSAATSQPIQMQVQATLTTTPATTPTPTTPTTTIAPQPNTVTVVATQPALITTTQLPPRGMPTIQIRPQGTTLTLSTPPVTATTSPTVATNLAVTNQQHTPTNITSTPTITTTPTIIKAEPYRFICCLLDNGVKCDRIAGNASFNLRIQKVVVTKKLNFELDPKVTHGYICEYHKSIITVAKKSTPIPRGEGKANARNYNNTSAANNNNTALEASAGVAVAPTTNNITYPTADLSRQTAAHQARGPITTLQQPVNLKLITNTTNQRLANNHHPTGVPVGTTLNSIPIVRQTVQGGTQIAYAHYQPAAAHQNQVTNMDVIMTNSNYDNTGGDNVATTMGPSSSGIDVDLQQLQVNTLRRYKRHFRVQTRPGLNKMQLAESLKGHFRTLPIIEKEAITYFVYIVKCFRNKLDHNPKAD